MSESDDELNRRQAIAKLGVFAAYTAPTMLVLLTSQRAMARSNEEPSGPSANPGSPPGDSGPSNPGPGPSDPGHGPGGGERDGGFHRKKMGRGSRGRRRER